MELVPLACEDGMLYNSVTSKKSTEVIVRGRNHISKFEYIYSVTWTISSYKGCSINPLIYAKQAIHPIRATLAAMSNVNNDI